MDSYDLSRIHVTRWGDRGPRLVMVHGGAQGGPVGGERNFAAQQAFAAEGWCVVVPDRPGHGASPSQGWPDDAERDGAWVADLLGGDAHLVGHSFGGAVALAAAALRPDAVRSLTLIEPAMLALAAGDPHVRKMLVRLGLTTLLTFSPARRADKVSRLLGIPAGLGGDGDEAEMAKLGRALKRIRIPKKAVLRRQLDIVRAAGIPLLTISGAWSEAFDAASAKVAELGGGRHVTAPSPHHFPQLASSAFNAILGDFMREADRRLGSARPVGTVADE